MSVARAWEATPGVQQDPEAPQRIVKDSYTLGHATVTVVIPSRDSASLLVDCLASVDWADEIIVVDMFSTDGTREICAAHHQCRLIERQDYIFANMNHGFSEARGDWIIRLDTDERITPQLAQEIQAVLRDA